MTTIEKIMWFLAVVILIVFMGFGAYFTVKGTKQDNARLEAYNNKITECRAKNGDKILSFVKECISSLKVEENAYIASDCEDIAIRNICN